MDPIEKSQINDSERMRLRAQILLSSEIIADYWPMRNFVHHNPLHGLENLSFFEAVKRGNQILGGKPYLANELYRNYFRSASGYSEIFLPERFYCLFLHLLCLLLFRFRL